MNLRTRTRRLWFVIRHWRKGYRCSWSGGFVYGPPLTETPGHYFPSSLIVASNIEYLAFVLAEFLEDWTREVLCGDMNREMAEGVARAWLDKRRDVIRPGR